VDIYWPEAFGTWLDRLEADARGGDSHARTILVYVARALDQLRNLPEPPAKDSETATLRWCVNRAGTRCGGSPTLTIQRLRSG
jgi:hypothetical protein